MIFKQVLLGLLSKAYKQDNGEVADLLNSEELTEEQGKELLEKFLTLDSNKVASIKEENKTAFQDGFKKAKAEVLGDFEKSILETFPSANKELKGLDLIKSLQGNSEKTITDSDVLSSLPYLNMEKRLKTEMEQAIAAKDQELKDVISTHKKDRVFSTIESKVMSIREQMGAVIPSDSHIANTASRNLLRDLKEHDFDIKEDGTILIVKDGKPMQDAHGNTVQFEDFAKTHVRNYYAISNNNGGSNSGSGSSDDSNKGQGAARVFKTQDEVMNFLDGDASYEDKQAVIQANAELLNS